jgi:hypothetical protein
MQAAMRKVPDSEAIAKELNDSDAKSCACTTWKTACFGFCGVLLEGHYPESRWVPITAERRREWFERLLALTWEEHKKSDG